MDCYIVIDGKVESASLSLLAVKHHLSRPPMRGVPHLRCVTTHLLLTLTLCTVSLSLALASPSPIDDVTPQTELPYQFYHTDGVGGNNAACWLSRLPFPPTEGIDCHLAHSISQIKGRQIWQCDGEQWRFCDGCRHLEAQLQGPKDLVGWKIQGC